MSHPVYTWYNAYVHVTNDTETQPSKRLRVVFRTSGKKGRRETILRYRLYSVSWFQDFYPRFCFTISSDTRAFLLYVLFTAHVYRFYVSLPPEISIQDSLRGGGWIISRMNGEVIVRSCSLFFSKIKLFSNFWKELIISIYGFNRKIGDQLNYAKV